MVGFNSCPREGGIPIAMYAGQSSVVSIPAPVKGASRSTPSGRSWRRCFNSCPREGGILIELIFGDGIEEFQFLPP